MDVARYTSATGKITKVLFDGRVFDSDELFHEFLVKEKHFTNEVATEYLTRLRNERTLPKRVWDNLLKDNGLYVAKSPRTKKK